jgi:hypothetical protein
MNVADGGHADGSALLDLQMNGVSQFVVLAPDNTNPSGGILLLSDLHLFRDASNPITGGSGVALSLRYANNPQAFRVYNSYTDDDNWERGFMGWIAIPNIFGLGCAGKGSGITRPVMFMGANFLLTGYDENASPTYNTDTAIFRNAPGVLEINSGNPGQLAGCYLKWGGTARVVGDQSIANLTTLGNIGGLIVNVNAGRTYAFEAELSFTCAAAAGIKCAISGSATVTNIIYDGWIVDSAANGIKGNAQATALGGTVAAAAITGTAGHVTIRGTIEVNAAGTLSVQAAQNVLNATATVVKRGSQFIVHDIT